MTYLHRVTDGNSGEALHIEPGMWLTIPATTSPHAEATIARLATIPHGNAVCTVGFTEELVPQGMPTIPPANTIPFPVGSPPPEPGMKNPFPEYDLSEESRFRTAPLPAGIAQAVIDDPNVLLRAGPRGPGAGAHHPADHLTKPVGRDRQHPVHREQRGRGHPGLGVRHRDRARAAGAEYLQLQYSQTALLNFRGLSFPHVTVGTLIKAF